MPFAELTDARCFYEVQGNGEPVVLIPGLGRDGASWETIVPALEKRFTIIRPDNRGIGRSVAKRRPHRIRDYAADMVELLDHLQIERAHLLGLSLGGIIAQRFAVDHASRVSSLVLISTAQGFGPYLRQMTGVILRGLRFPPKPSLLRTVELLSTSPTHLDANPTWIEEKLNGRKGSLATARAVMRQLRALAGSRFEEGEYRIDAPALVIAGEFDALIPHCYARQMADMIAGSRFVLLDGVGHNPITEAPQRVLPLVERFLLDHPIARTASRRDFASTKSNRPASELAAPPRLPLGEPV